MHNFFRSKQSSHQFHKQDSQRASGGITKGGVTYFFHPKLFVDVSAEYVYHYFTFRPSSSSSDMNISIIKLGAGIGYQY